LIRSDRWFEHIENPLDLLHQLLELRRLPAGMSLAQRHQRLGQHPGIVGGSAL
jgi:hypothetical protein